MSPHALHGAAIVGVVFMSTAVAVGTAQYAFGLFIPSLADTYGWTRTEISASLSFAAVSGLTAPLIGRIMDRIGARPVIVFSLVISGLGLVLRPLMTELWHWYALSFLQFVTFAGMTTLPTGKLVAAWYPTARGRMLGIAAMGNNFGGLTVPIGVAAVLAMASWREAFAALGATCFVLAVIAWFIVRERPGTTHAENAPSTATTTQTGYTAREAVRTRLFYIILLVVTLGYFTYSTILSHALAHLVNLGVSATEAAVALSTLAMGGFAGKVVFGTMTDKIGPRLAAIANLSGQAVTGALVAYLDSPDLVRYLLPVFGLFMGGFGVVHTVLVQDAFGLKHFGAIMGLMSSSSVVAFGLGPLLAGYAFDRYGSYSVAFMTVAGFFALGAILLSLTRFKPMTRTA
ncbi:MAG: MFS transporter [Pseudomonadota bacterium]